MSAHVYPQWPGKLSQVVGDLRELIEGFTREEAACNRLTAAIAGLVGATPEAVHQLGYHRWNKRRKTDPELHLSQVLSELYTEALVSKPKGKRH